MKTKIFRLGACALILSGLMLTGCSDEPIEPGVRPGLEDCEGCTVSSFSVAREHYALPDGTAEVDVALIAADGLTHCFRASVEEEESTHRFHMRIPSGYELPDGEYVMTMRAASGRAIAGRLLATFADRKLASVSIILPGYMLDGSGTEADPYIIADSDDFEMFIINLGDDVKTNGAGLFFRQTGDVTPSDQSSLAPGRGYWGAAFAGYYDGGGHEVRNLYYRGSGRDSSDTGFGLFTRLSGTASVSNLTFTGVNVSGLYGDSGIVAGTASGSISLSGISLSGTFEGDDEVGNNIGGLVGHFTSGNLDITQIKLSSAISGYNDLGGLVGMAEGDISVSDVTTPDYHFSVSGHSRVGGVAGHTKGAVSISGVTLEHKVTNEDSDIRIIEGSGSGIGAMVGWADDSEVMLENVRVLCPVGGAEACNVGGLIGYVVSDNVSVDNCRVYSVVAGKDDVGGLFGNVYNNYGTFTIKGEDLSTRVAVDDAAALVSGSNNVGGFAGRWWGSLTLDCKVKINVPVTGSGSCTGGFIGYADMLGIFNVSPILVGDVASTSGGDNVMKVTGGDNTGGLFGSITTSTVQGNDKFDFSENGAHIRVPEVSRFTSVYSCVVKGKSCVGGVAGSLVSSKLQYIHADCRVDGTEYVGGIIGKVDNYNASCTVEDCTFNGTIDCPDSNGVGGIVGWYYSSFSGMMHDCVNYAKITGGDNTGGVVGYVQRVPQTLGSDDNHVEIRWCVNTAPVSGTLHVGGVVGRAHVNDANKTFPDDEALGILITACMNQGKVTASGGSSNSASSGVGGIAGFTNFRTAITQCANHGDITGTGAFHGVGGVAGSMGGDPTGTGLTNSFRNVQLSECCNTGTIDSGNSSSYVGGVLGYQEEGNKSDVQDCYNTGVVKPKQSHDSGGIVGCVDHMTNIYRCVNSGKVEHGNAAIGTHKSASLFDHGSLYYLDGTGSSWPSATKVSASKFTDQSSFKGLDFDKTWKMGTSGPQLRNCSWQEI